MIWTGEDVRRVVWIAICALCLSGVMFGSRPLPIGAQNAAASLWWVSFDDATDLAQVAATHDVWEVDHAQQRALVVLREDEAVALAERHALVRAADQSPLVPSVGAAQQSDGIPGFACYRTNAETATTLAALVANYPQLATLVDIGDSWDKTQAGGPPGDDLTVLVLTNRAREGEKFRLMVMGAIHARELVTAETVLRFAEELVAAYGNDPAVTWLLDHGEVHLLPIANPDGRLFAEDGLLWRKNTNNDFICPVSPPFTTYGVDLNRNSSFQWNACPFCSSGDPCATTYRGTAPASEPEVAAIQAYLASIFPDVRDDDLDAAAPDATPGIFVSLHSYGQLVLYPWGWTNTPPPNAAGLDTLARRFADGLNYFACQAGADNCLYRTDGTTDDWSYGRLGVASFTFELGTAFFQACSDFETTIAPATLATLHDALRWAARPYQLPSGPIAGPLNVALDANGQLTATLTATQTLGIPLPATIAGGKVTLDEAPWQPEAPAWPLAPVDGDFDSVVEALSGTIDTRCLPNGAHTLLVQVQDKAGNSGAPVFGEVTVSQTRTFTVSVGDIVEGAPGVPVRHTLTITNNANVTDTFMLTPSPRAAENVSVTLPQTTTPSIAPGARVTVGVDVTVDMVSDGQNKTAAQTAAVIDIFSVNGPQQCRQAILRTAVAVEQRYYLPWLPIGQLD